MIQFLKKESTVRVAINYKTHAIDYTMYMHWDAGNEIAADAVVNALRDQYQSSVEAEIRAAYEQGWKDAKAKRAKQTWFKSIIKHYRS